MICAQINITGRVQGVWFRDYVSKSANRLKLRGWVKNELNGSVSAEVEGEKSIIEELIKRINVGSPLSKVKKVNLVWNEFENKYQSFRIIR